MELNIKKLFEGRKSLSNLVFLMFALMIITITLIAVLQ